MLARWIFIVLLVALPLSAVGATFTVDSTADAIDANPGDGHCATAAGQCTLRAAVQEANATSGADTIMVPAGTYRLKIPGAVEDAAATGDLDLLGDVSIIGAGPSATIIIAKKAKDRVFEVFGSAAISGVTIKRGLSPANEQGGCIRVRGALTLTDAIVTRCHTLVEGGGLYAEGTSLTVRDTMFTHNRADRDAGGVEVYGGTADLTRVVIARNTTGNESGGVEVNRAVVTMTSCQLRGNICVTEGGALEIEDGGRVMFDSCQITGNHARKGAGVVVESDPSFPASSASALSTTITNNKKGNCVGPVTSLGGNHDSDGSCKF
jgi:CSLREA domain-containing protein